MKPSQLTPEQIRLALINARGDYARQEKIMLLRALAQRWKSNANKNPAL